MSTLNKIYQNFYATDDGETINLFAELNEARQFADKLGGRQYFIGQVLGENLPITAQTRRLVFPKDRF